MEAEVISGSSGTKEDGGVRGEMGTGRGGDIAGDGGVRMSGIDVPVTESACQMQPSKEGYGYEYFGVGDACESCAGGCVDESSG